MNKQLLVALLLFLRITSVLSTCIATCYDGIKNQNEEGADCGGNCPACQPSPSPSMPLIGEAVCELKTTTGITVTGSFKFTPDPNNIYTGQEPVERMNVNYVISGLTPGDHKYHVHNLGNAWDKSGWSSEEHFVGDPVGRLELGLLNSDIPATSDGTESTGSFVEDQATLYGKKSILGRSMVVHDVDPTSTILPRAAQCVIGRVSDASPSVDVPDAEPVKRAICVFDRPQAYGFAEFTTNYYGNTDVKLFVKVPANAQLKVRVYSSGSFASPGNVFQGSPLNSSRYHGEIGGRDYVFTSDANGLLSAWMTDNVIRLSGPNNILGRSVLIETLGGTDYGQCIIGLSEGYGTYLPGDNGVTFFGAGQTTQPPRTLPIRAHANLRSPTGNAAVRGFVEFRQTAATHPKYPVHVRVSYMVAGLSPLTSYDLIVTETGNLGTNPAAIATASLGGAFVGYAVDPPSTRTAAGALGSFTTDSNGNAKAQFFDRVISLYNYNSILGRAFTVVTTTGQTVVAYGIIGVSEIYKSIQVYDAPPATAAAALLFPTTGNTATGSITFTQGANQVAVTLSLSGLVSDTYTFHIHEYGDVFADNGQTVGPHFLGTARERGNVANNNWCEAGALNNGVGVASNGPTLSYTYNDVYITLQGLDSIIGRGVIIHNSAGARIAQGVVGVVTTSSAFTGPVAEQIYVAPSNTGGGDCPECPPETPDGGDASTLSSSLTLILLLSLLFFY